jgi:hypothetical protein
VNSKDTSVPLSIKFEVRILLLFCKAISNGGTKHQHSPHLGLNLFLPVVQTPSKVFSSTSIYSKIPSKSKIMAEEGTICVRFYEFGDAGLRTERFDFARSSTVSYVQKEVGGALWKRFIGLNYYDLQMWKVCL